MKKKDPRIIMKTIELNGVIYEVLDPKEHGYKKGFAYVHEDAVYIYGGKHKGKDPFEPGFFYKVNGEFVYINPEPEKADEYSTDRILELSDKGVINAVNNDENFKKVDPSVIEDAEEYFAPEILEEDDILKRIVKKVLQEQKLTFKNVKSRFKNEYDVTNMKSALLKPSAMSIRYFNKWVELTDISSIKVRVEFIDKIGMSRSINETIDYNVTRRSDEE